MISNRTYITKLLYVLKEGIFIECLEKRLVKGKHYISTTYELL